MGQGEEKIMVRKNHITSTQEEVLQRAIDFLNCGEKPPGVTAKEHAKFKRETIKALGIKKCAVCGKWNYSGQFLNDKKPICCKCLKEDKCRCLECGEYEDVKDMLVDVERGKTLCRKCQEKIVEYNCDNGIKRVCIKCKKEYPLTEKYFSWNIRSNGYLRGVCRTCRGVQHREYNRKISALNKVVDSI